MRRFDLNDSDVLAAVTGRPRMPTYVYRNILSSGRCHLKTASVLSRLKRMERDGKVRRVPTSYAVMLAWEPT